MTSPRAPLLLPLALALSLVCGAGCGPEAPAPAPADGPATTSPPEAGGPRSDGQPGTELTPDGTEPFHISDADRHYRPAAYDDMTGRWKQVAATALSELDITPPWYSGEQVFEFTAEGKMKTFLVPPPEVGDRDAAYKTWLASAGTIEFELLDQEGLVRVSEPSGNNYLVVATYYTRDSKVPKKGDLTLTYIEKKTRASLFYRLLRRE